MMNKNRILVLTGLAVALSIAALLSPFASKDPDGLDRVAKDLKFEEKATTESLNKKLPFSQVFDEYSLKSVPNEKVATGLAGVTGTLVVFGLSWGVGKIAVKKATKE